MIKIEQDTVDWSQKVWKISCLMDKKSLYPQLTITLYIDLPS
jgi:hypothetical protein